MVLHCLFVNSRVGCSSAGSRSRLGGKLLSAPDALASQYRDASRKVAIAQKAIMWRSAKATAPPVAAGRARTENPQATD
jgi:hypothetical protein